MRNDWYLLHHPEKINSPSLLVYPDRIGKNISEMIRMAGSPARLVPHVKTYKMKEVVEMQMEQGIHSFKCATIAEAEMLGDVGVKKVLIAYQLTGPNLNRLLQLVIHFPNTHFASLVDNFESGRQLNDLFMKHDCVANFYIDIDDGMHRTGISVSEDIFGLYKKLVSLSHLHFDGLHVYDGHIRTTDLNERKQLSRSAFEPITKVADKIKSDGNSDFVIIAGGSPSFPVHAENTEVLCSPGTSLLWDAGYSTIVPDEPFVPAAVLLTRIISKPIRGRITTDLGHKAVGAENPIDRRVVFLNLQNYKVVSQSEEHLVIETEERDWEKLNVGDELYGVPWHICPSVALYDKAEVVREGEVVGQWDVVARKRKLTI